MKTKTNHGKAVVFMARCTDLDANENYIYFHLSEAIDTAPLWGMFLLSQPQVVI
jgi:hypothetical protein